MCFQFSRWTFQAALMNGKIESINWEIKPDQMQTIYPIFSLIMLFFLKPVVYPFVAKIGIRTPLQKLILCDTFAILAFMCTTLLQYVIFVSELQLLTYTYEYILVTNNYNIYLYSYIRVKPMWYQRQKVDWRYTTI